MRRRPAEQIYEAPAACEGLLPNHHPPVTPDDLISPQTETSERSKTPEQWDACCSAASSIWRVDVFPFFLINAF